MLLQRFFCFLPCTAVQALAAAEQPPDHTHVELSLQAFFFNAQPVSWPRAALRHAASTKASTQPAASSSPVLLSCGEYTAAPSEDLSTS
jgi:hypothetical protein